MTKRTSKKQQARELAMRALAEQIERQQKVQAATQRALLALDRTDDNDDSSDDDREDQPEDAPVGDEGHWTDAQHSEQHE